MFFSLLCCAPRRPAPTAGFGGTEPLAFDEHTSIESWTLAGQNVETSSLAAAEEVADHEDDAEGADSGDEDDEDESKDYTPVDFLFYAVASLPSTLSSLTQDLLDDARGVTWPPQEDSRRDNSEEPVATEQAVARSTQPVRHGNQYVVIPPRLDAGDSSADEWEAESPSPLKCPRSGPWGALRSPRRSPRDDDHLAEPLVQPDDAKIHFDPFKVEEWLNRLTFLQAELRTQVQWQTSRRYLTPIPCNAAAVLQFEVCPKTVLEPTTGKKQAWNAPSALLERWSKGSLVLWSDDDDDEESSSSDASTNPYTFTSGASARLPLTIELLRISKVKCDQACSQRSTVRVQYKVGSCDYELVILRKTAEDAALVAAGLTECINIVRAASGRKGSMKPSFKVV